MKFFVEIFRYRELLRELVKRDLKVKYRRSALGILWSVFNPLLFMMVTTFIFSAMFKNQIENFPLYFLSGQIIYAFFAEATGQAQMGLIENGALIKKVYIPKYIFPISKACLSLVNTLFSLVAVVLIILFMRFELPPTSILFFIPILLMFMFSIGIGLLLSSLTVFYRDIIHIYSVVLSVLTFFSATFYPIEIIPEKVRGVIEYNPIYVYISYFRDLVLNGQIPDAYHNLIAISYCMASMVIGYMVFRKNENKILLYI